MTKLRSADYFFTGFQFLLFLSYFLNYYLFKVGQLLPDFIYGILTAIGIALCVLAIFRLQNNLSPFPRPKSKSNLVKDGVFKYIRHPIYTGIFISFLSYGLYLHSSSKIVVSLLLLVLFYFKSVYEEKLLEQKFSDYLAYKRKTGRFFPKFIHS